LNSLVARAIAVTLLFSVSSNIFAQPLVININVVGLNVNQSAASTQINQVCSDLSGSENAQQSGLQEVCDLVDSLDENDPDDARRLQEITDAIAPEEAFALNDSLLVVSDYQTTNVHARLNALRNPILNSSTAQLPSQSTLEYNSSNHALKNQVGGGASADLVSSLGTFVNGHVSSGDIDGGRLQQDADVASSSLTFGGDYRFNANIVAGLGVGFMQDDTSFSRTAGGAQSDGFNVTAFASWYETDEGYLDVVLDLGRANYELERSVSIFAESSLTAISSPASTSTSVTVSGGRNFTPFGMDLGGYFRLSYTGATIEGYSETLKVENPGFASLVSVSDQKAVSTKMVVGLNLSKAFSTSKAVILPLLRLEYVKENNEKKDAIEATLIGTDVTAQYQGEDRVADYSNLGIGASAIFGGGKSAYAFYETHLQHDVVSQNWLKAGIRLEF